MGATSASRKIQISNPAVAPWSQSIESLNLTNKSQEQQITKEQQSLPPMKHGKLENQTFFSSQTQKSVIRSPKNISFRKGSTVKQVNLKQYSSTQGAGGFHFPRHNDDISVVSPPFVQLKSTFNQQRNSPSNNFVSFNNQDIVQSLLPTSSSHHSLTEDHSYLTYSMHKKQKEM